jgi:glycosyltransferase involved in cell wall biosynthesis
MNLGLKSLIDPVFYAVERVRPTLSNGLFSQPVPPRRGDVTSSETSGVSVIIPAHNAEETLEATLDSVARQTHAVWEALVVNDGSTDATLATVESWVDRDPRFRLLSQKKSGVSVARNSGLREARYPFVLFLDSDDRIAATHLERMVGMFLRDSTLDAVHCGWRRVFPSGDLGPPDMAPDQEDLFEYFAFRCAFIIHSCVVRRELALAVDGFDASLTTCEDWDFFQRVARTGAHFGRVSEVLAFYHFRSNSASQDNRSLLTDARVVVDRGHGRDLRTSIAAQVHAEGRDPAYRNLALYYIVTYLAALEIGAGRDGLGLLYIGDFPPVPNLLPEAVAGIIRESLPTALNRSEQDWPVFWNQVNAPLVAFLLRLEAQSSAPALAFAALRHLEKQILLAAHDNAPLLLGSTYRVNLDLQRRIPDVSLPPEADRLVCRLTLKNRPLGAVELPGTGVLTGFRIAKATLERSRRLFLLLLLRSALTPNRGLYVGLATFRDLLRRATLRLLHEVLAAKPKDRLSALRRVRHHVASVVRGKLSQVIATQSRLAGRACYRHRWKYLALQSPLDGHGRANRSTSRVSTRARPGLRAARSGL